MKPKNLMHKVHRFQTDKYNKRSYNEMYLSNPTLMGVFAYVTEGKTDNSVEYSDNHGCVKFLKEFAPERNLPLVIFRE